MSISNILHVRVVASFVIILGFVVCVSGAIASAPGGGGGTGGGDRGGGNGPDRERPGRAVPTVSQSQIQPIAPVGLVQSDDVCLGGKFASCD